MKEFITLKEVQETIMVSNPGGRSITIETQKSGYNEVQTLTSAIFPDKIFGEYIGLAKLKDNSIHPAYMLNTSRQKLILKGFIGFSNGPEILNEICSKLLFQNEFIVIRSAVESDFIIDSFNDNYEKLSRLGFRCIELDRKEKDFWVASNILFPDLKECFIKYVNTDLGLICTQFSRDYDNKESKVIGKAIRPVVILKSKVEVKENFEYKWIKP